MSKQISLEKKILSTNEWGLIALLHDKIIHNLELGLLYIEDGNYEALNEVINKSREILAELLITFKSESDLSTNLKDLYVFVNKSITDGEIKKEKEALEAGIKVLLPIYNAFLELEMGGEGKVLTGLTYGKEDLDDYLNRDEISFKG